MPHIAHLPVTYLFAVAFSTIHCSSPCDLLVLMSRSAPFIAHLLWPTCDAVAFSITHCSSRCDLFVPISRWAPLISHLNGSYSPKVHVLTYHWTSSQSKPHVKKLLAMYNVQFYGHSWVCLFVFTSSDASGMSLCVLFASSDASDMSLCVLFAWGDVTGMSLCVL